MEKLLLFYFSMLAMQNLTVKNAPNGSIRLQFTIKSTHTHYTQPKPDRRDRCDMKWWDMTRYYHLIMITISWITTNLKLGNSVTKYLIFQQVCCHPDSRALRRRSIFKEGHYDINLLQLTSSPFWMTKDKRIVISFIVHVIQHGRQDPCHLNLSGMASNHL